MQQAYPLYDTGTDRGAENCQLGALLPRTEHLVHAQPCKKNKIRHYTAADPFIGKSLAV
jgi:hypothetical protein